MRKLSLIITAVIVICVLQACNSNTKNGNSITDTSDTTETDTSLTDTITKVNPVVDKEDTQFAMEAASGGLTEVELGRIAQKNGASAQVKNFGTMMIKDHSKANKKLAALAKSKNITLPTAPNADDQKTIDKLAKLTGKDFDKAYIKDMIDDHKNDISEFQNASTKCQDPELKAFATKTLPVLQTHLDAVNAINDSMK